MKFHIRRATIEDIEGIINSIQRVSGPNEFIKNHLEEWIAHEKHYYPLVALEEQHQEYAGFSNTLIYGRYLWLEGLRVEATYRNNHVATKLIKESQTPPGIKNVNSIGFTTRNDNSPMNTLAKKQDFKLLGQQLVLVKRKNEHKTVKHTTEEKQSVFNNGNNFYTALQQRYHSQLFTSFFKIPPNELGEKMFGAIPGVETPEYYVLYEKEHAETSAQRGIFTLYVKDEMSTGKVFEVISELEELEQVRHYPSYSFTVPAQDMKITNDMDQLAQERGFEVHILNFYEKGL